MKKALAWVLGEAGNPQRLAPATIDLERHLEDWVDADISIVVDDVLLIGRQVATSYGTVIDLLGIDADGNLVIIELKRDQTLRETVAQGIEYAAWASKLLYDQVVDIAAKRFAGPDTFAAAFEKKFGEPLPETLNSGQRIILVAPSISDSTAGVIEYLSETYHVPINGVSFDAFTVDGRRVLMRHTVREEETPLPPSTKKRPSRTLEEFRRAADENGVLDLVEHLLTMRDIVPSIERYVSTFALVARTPDDRRPLTAFSVYPTSATNPGRVDIVMSPSNLSALYGRTVDECTTFVEEIQALGVAEKCWTGWLRAGLQHLDEVKEFDRRFRSFVSKATSGEPLPESPALAPQ